MDRDWNTIDDEVLQWMNVQANVPGGSTTTSFPNSMLSTDTVGGSEAGTGREERDGEVVDLSDHAAPKPRTKKELVELSKDQIDDAVLKRKCNWRKYGQKNLRGKRFQGMDKIRCYYKCNYPGCPVRKQVEKDTDAADNSADTKVKMTGEHNHPPLDPIGDTLDDWQCGDSLQQALQGSVEGSSGTHHSGGMGFHMPEGSAKPRSEAIPEVDHDFVTELNERNLNFVIVDPQQVDCPIIFSSPGFTALTGYTAEEIRGRNCRFLQGKDTNREAIKQISRAIQEVKPIGIILLNYKKNGTPFWNLLSITPTMDQEGNLLSFIGVQMDVSASLTDKSKSLKIQQAKASEADRLIKEANAEADAVDMNGSSNTQQNNMLNKDETNDSGDGKSVSQ